MCLRKVPGKCCCSPRQMTASSSEIEAVIKTRSFTSFYTDVSEQTLLPSSKLVATRRLGVLSSQNDTLVAVPKLEVLKGCANLQRLLSHFCERRRKGYLLELRHAQRRKFSSGKDMKRNDLVLVYEAVTSRISSRKW